MTSPTESVVTGTDTPIYDELASTVPGFADVSDDPPAADPTWSAPSPARTA